MMQTLSYFPSLGEEKNGTERRKCGKKPLLKAGLSRRTIIQKLEPKKGLRIVERIVGLKRLVVCPEKITSKRGKTKRNGGPG